MKVIGEGAFESCTQLASVSLGNQVEQIKDRAFDKCALSQINLPQSVREVGIRAFGAAEVIFSGEAFDIPNSYETSATRLSNEDYRNLTGEQGEAGVAVVGIEHAYAMLDGAARSYTLSVAPMEDVSVLEQACARSFKTSVPGGMAAYDIQLTDSSAIPITKLGHQTLTVILPVPEGLSGQKLQVMTLDRNGQPELLAVERVMMEGVESVKFETNHLSPFGIYSLGYADVQEEVLELSVSMMSQSNDPDTMNNTNPVWKMFVSGLMLCVGILLIAVSVMQRGRQS